MGPNRNLGSNTTGPCRWSSEPWTASCGCFHPSERKAQPVRPSREGEARPGPSANRRAHLESPGRGSGNLVGVALPRPRAPPVKDFTKARVFPLLPGTAAHIPPKGPKAYLAKDSGYFLGLRPPQEVSCAHPLFGCGGHFCHGHPHPCGLRNSPLLTR